MFVFLKSLSPGATVHMSDTWAAVKDMSPEQLKQYLLNVGRECTFVTTVAEGDALYVPAGYIVTERAQGSSSVGVQRRVLPKSNAPSMKALLGEMMSEKPFPAESPLKAILAALPTQGVASSQAA